ncbi:Serine/threonine-protein kinase hal4 [Zancudomyces culisetae]|uniref:non-specific serine/threonine protein kinase n=1 Tax=Zancudomyces culisetae TaxID=1213189 RepID=A0A1R1PRZ6_ZANCU|nr:Serine/threonine-protein kinase hal4 [Zancudomyces culisetae]|eukprot:OMH83755.1 Serine/threonine-protein kinase hal4 [Zancudomyces culisetae]
MNKINVGLQIDTVNTTFSTINSATTCSDMCTGDKYEDQMLLNGEGSRRLDNEFTITHTSEYSRAEESGDENSSIGLETPINECPNTYAGCNSKKQILSLEKLSIDEDSNLQLVENNSIVDSVDTDTIEPILCTQHVERRRPLGLSFVKGIRRDREGDHSQKRQHKRGIHGNISLDSFLFFYSKKGDGRNKHDPEDDKNCSERQLSSSYNDGYFSKRVADESDKNSVFTHGVVISRTNSTRTHDSGMPSLKEKYGVLKRSNIGKGATAVVRISQKNTGKGGRKLFAVKRYTKKSKSESERSYIKRLTSEFCISSMMRHKNVIQTLDLTRDKSGKWCQVMEYCSGGDLLDLIKNDHMNQTEKDCLFKQLLQGIAYLHSIGVAHRDIKPDNLLLDDKCVLKVADFGVSEVFSLPWQSSIQLSKGCVGSDPYIAPECFVPSNEFEASKADVWSCGIVYLVMTNNSFPWHVAKETDENFRKFAKRCQSGDGNSNTSACSMMSMFRNIDPDAVNTLSKLLSLNPEERPRIDKVLLDDWMVSIDVCKNGVGAKTGVHNHIPNKHSRSF